MAPQGDLGETTPKDSTPHALKATSVPRGAYFPIARSPFPALSSWCECSLDNALTCAAGPQLRDYSAFGCL
eukprot:498647-Alexandrium_andersonii.AAC.1